MKIEKAKSRLEFANKRTGKIHQKIGELSSHFAGLELQLFEMLSKRLNPSEPDRPEFALSQLSFRQCINALKQYVKNYFDDPEMQSQMNNITKDLEAIATKRNEIIHSSWIAYSTGNYGQHRARSKGGKSSGLSEHDGNPEENISNLIESIEKTLFDLICFEDLITEKDSEQLF
jgi:hypothetical protein